MIALVDYGAGNIRSLVNAFEHVGQRVVVTSEVAEIQAADAIVLPGVGAFGDGMRRLEELRLTECIAEAVCVKKKPYLGICLGLQFVALRSSEWGGHRGFGWLPGTVERLSPTDPRVKVPHIGWTEVKVRRKSALYEGLEEPPVFYFAHSFHLVLPEAVHEGVTTATCLYGGEIVASIEHGNVFGVQFHPEKSQRCGLGVLRNFVNRI